MQAYIIEKIIRRLFVAILNSLAWNGKYLWCASFDEGKIYQIYIGAQ